uniref:Uncharacterized protein n=1 Tax=Leersia perrieri TaxID=77586 RepID=A0A0D9XZN1_9ORYZ
MATPPATMTWSAAAATEDKVVDVAPAAMEYIRHLVNNFKTKSFTVLCFEQNDKHNVTDLFERRPEPTAVPAAVARALDAVEEILMKGSPTLAADERLEARVDRTHQAEMVGHLIEQVAYLDVKIKIATAIGGGETLDKKRRRLNAVRAAMARSRAELAAVSTAADGGWEEAAAAVVSRLERLNVAEEEEAPLAAAVEKMSGLKEELEEAMARLEDEQMKLDAMPKIGESQGREDEATLSRARGRFYLNDIVLERFIESADA